MHVRIWDFGPPDSKGHDSRGVDTAAYLLAGPPVRPELADQIPAVVHVDQTARVQTVDVGEHPRFAALIEEFHEITGVPVVLKSVEHDGQELVGAVALDLSQPL